MWHVMVKTRSFFQQGWQCKGYAENKLMVTPSITSAVSTSKETISDDQSLSAMKVWYGSL